MGPLLRNQWGGFSGICAALREGIMKLNLTIRIFNCLDLIFTSPLLFCRLLRFGYTFRKIYLGEGQFTIVEPSDYYLIRHFKWFVNGNGTSFYAVRSVIAGPGETRLVGLHREIMNFPEGFLVDHKNCDSLDNRRENLRLATHAENVQNRRKTSRKTSSRYVGVSFHKKKGKWMAVIGHKGKNIWLGRFDNEIDAAKAYDAAARKYYGGFARLNFPEENCLYAKRCTLSADS